MPEVAASLGRLDDSRVKFETVRCGAMFHRGGCRRTLLMLEDEMLELEAAYSAEVERASSTLPALVDRLMREVARVVPSAFGQKLSVVQAGI